MCYRPGEVSFNRPCPECGSMQCNESMYCAECGAFLPYMKKPDAASKVEPPKNSPTSQNE